MNDSLLQLIEDHFNLEELKPLADCVGVKHENLAGDTLKAQVRSLVEYCQRHGQLRLLIVCCQRERPRVKWPALPPIVAIVPQVPPTNGSRIPGWCKFTAWIAISLTVVVAGYLLWQFWPGRPVRVAVRVADERGVSIQGASVLVFFANGSRQEYTDSTGVATLSIPYTKEQPDVRVFVETNQYQIYDREITLPDETAVDARLKDLEPDSGDVVVWVVDDQGVPVPNAQVVLVADSDPFSHVTDSNGIAKFPLTFPGGEIEALISVETTGFAINNQQVTLLPNRLQEIQLKSGGEELAVIREFPEPQSMVVGAEVAVTEPPGTFMAETVTKCPEPTNLTVAYGDLVSCPLVNSGEIDRFQFSGEVGDEVLVNVAYLGGGLRPCVELRSPNGTTQSACANSLTNSLDVILEENGDYILLITDRSGRNAGNYSLTIDSVSNPYPNAVSLTFGRTVTGTLELGGDKDIFLVDGYAGDEVIFHAAYESGGFRPCLTLIAPDGSRNQACENSLTNQMDMTLAETGRYVVLMTDRSNTSTGQYALTLQCVTGACLP